MLLNDISRDWREIAQEAQRHRDDSIRKVDESLLESQCGGLPLNVTGFASDILTPSEIQMTELLPEDLVQALASGSTNCVDVIRAFLRRAGLAQTLANCITELLPERAIQRAEELDQHWAQHGKPVGPLHGLPVSVKEHINMKGLDVNGAYCAGWGTTAHEDVYLLRKLWDAGVVFYVRTTQPQLIMHLETSNNLYGNTVNPFNRSLTAGGSSGGEGALIALRGSCLGIGSDIGGSIRSPAANNGLFGLRPTAKRVSDQGSAIPPDGEDHILGVMGPLSTSLRGIDLFMRAVLANEPWLTDPSLVPLPWSISTPHLPVKMKVAVMWNDGVVKPHPPIQRALCETVDKLREAPDIEIVDWTPYKHDEAWRIISALYYCDGGETDKEIIGRSGEPWLPLSRWILSENPDVRRRDIPELWDLHERRNQYRREYAHEWNKTTTFTDEHGNVRGMVDVILCPVGPGAAPPLENAKYWLYTSQWNLLDYPALVVPLGTRVDMDLDKSDEGYIPKNPEDRFNHEMYSPDKYIDAPLSLQIVGRRFEDEKVMQAAERMSKYCRFRAA